MLSVYREHHHGRVAHFFIVHLGPSLVLLALLPVWHSSGCFGSCRPGYLPNFPNPMQCSACLFQHYIPMSEPEDPVSTVVPARVSTTAPTVTVAIAYTFHPILPPANGPPA